MLLSGVTGNNAGRGFRALALSRGFIGALGLFLVVLTSCQSPIEQSSEPTQPRLIPEADGVSNALNRYLLNLNALAGSPYEAAYQDLDGDGVEEAMVILQGPDWCGLRGCPLLIFQGLSNNDFRFLSRTEPVRRPILISANRTNGWQDLILGTTVKGRPEDVLIHYELDGYPPDATQGQRVISHNEMQLQPAF